MTEDAWQMGVRMTEAGTSSFARTVRVRLYSTIVKRSGSHVQHHAAAYVCLQVVVTVAITSFPERASADPAQSADMSPAAIVAARELFREATDDVDAGRYTIALEKFQRVARIRETAAVRFNVGKCEEKLGRIGSALASYEIAMQLAQREPRGEELVQNARNAAEPLRPRVPRLTLTLGASPPRELTVSLDGAALPVASLGVALPVDPGEHVVEADAPGRRHGRWVITLAEGRADALSVALDDGPDPGPAPLTTSAVADGADAPAGDSADRSWWTVRRATGVGAVALGAAAGILSAAFVIRHNDAVTELRTACTSGCPESRRAELETMHDAAVRDQTIAIVTGALSGAAIVTGAVLLLWPTARTSAARRGLHIGGTSSTAVVTGTF